MKQITKSPDKIFYQKRVSEYLIKEFLVWEHNFGVKKTYKEFAEFLGISPQLMNKYLKAERLPSLSNIRKIAEKLGPKLYSVAGFKPPNEDLNFLIERWSELSDEQIDHILNIAKKE